MATAEVAPAYAPEDPSLPKPWTGLIDGGSGALYYWNTETNVTQYEKPAALPPQSAAGSLSSSMPKLTPIPAARSQAPNNNMPQHELGQQMLHQQPFQQMPINQPQYMMNQQTQQHLPNQNNQYPPMQMNQMVHQEIPNMNEPSMTQYQGQQQQGFPGSHQAPPNGFLAEKDARRQISDPAGFTTPSFSHAGGPSGDTRFLGPVPHVPQSADYLVRPDQQSGRHQNAGGVFSELQQVRADANPRQQPPSGPQDANQMEHARSRPLVGQNIGYMEDQHERGKGEYYSSGSNGESLMFQQQPKFANISHTTNQQGMRTGASQSIAPGHTGGLNVAPVIAMSKIHDHAANVAPLGQSPRVFNSSSSTNISPVDLYRQHHEITVTGGGVPDPFMSFEATGFPPEILREILSAGFPSPTPIQAQTWPIALQSRDIVAIAKTGSGKTLGYLIPAFLHLRQCRNNPQVGPTVVVLSPTRELACQIQDEAVKFGRASRISCTCLYGGAPKGAQLREIERGVDLVVATPGRLNDILEMKKINFSQVSFLVLDEADRMLDMGFEPQIRKIVSEIPPHRQTLMYTATWPKEVRKIAEDLLVKSVQVNIGNVDDLSANKSITQYVEVVPAMEKQRRLEQIVRTQERGSKIIIFCSTKRLCDQISRNMRGYGAAAIHGDKSQGERDHVLNQFRAGKAPILVATDVAARGLDVKDIRVVINYDFPNGIEDYVHRIGRTGRAGATGIAHTFISDQDWKHASDLVKMLEGSSQQVPPQVREMAARGASSFSRGRGHVSRWDSGGGRGMRVDGGNAANRWDGGRGMSGGRGMRDGGGFGGRGRSDFASGGRGGRVGFDRGPGGGGRGWQDRGINGRGRYDSPRRPVDRRRDRSYSRSPERARAGGYSSDDSRSRSRSRSRSLDRPQRVRRSSGFDGPSSTPALPVEAAGQVTSLP